MNRFGGGTRDHWSTMRERERKIIKTMSTWKILQALFVYTIILIVHVIILVSILSTNADTFTVTLVSFFLATSLDITGSIVDNGGVFSVLLYRDYKQWTGTFTLYQ